MRSRHRCWGVLLPSRPRLRASRPLLQRRVRLGTQRLLLQNGAPLRVQRWGLRLLYSTRAQRLLRKAPTPLSTARRRLGDHWAAPRTPGHRLSQRTPGHRLSQPRLRRRLLPCWQLPRDRLRGPHRAPAWCRPDCSFQRLQRQAPRLLLSSAVWQRGCPLHRLRRLLGQGTLLGQGMLRGRPHRGIAGSSGATSTRSPREGASGRPPPTPTPRAC